MTPKTKGATGEVTRSARYGRRRPGFWIGPGCAFFIPPLVRLPRCPGTVSVSRTGGRFTAGPGFFFGSSAMMLPLVSVIRFFVGAPHAHPRETLAACVDPR